jgi:hypothetical protein
MKFAHKGYLTGNHKDNCPFEMLAAAGQECIVLRDRGTAPQKAAAEEHLSEKIGDLRAAMTKIAVCPFPVCKYNSGHGHRLECPFNELESARARR